MTNEDKDDNNIMMPSIFNHLESLLYNSGGGLSRKSSAFPQKSFSNLSPVNKNATPQIRPKIKTRDLDSGRACIARTFVVTGTLGSIKLAAAE